MLKIWADGLTLAGCVAVQLAAAGREGREERKAGIRAPGKSLNCSLSRSLSILPRSVKATSVASTASEQQRRCS